MNQTWKDSIILFSAYAGMMRRYPFEFSMAVMGIITQIVFYVLYPLAFKHVFNEVVPAKDFNMLLMIVLEVGVLLVICGAGAYFQIKYMARLGGKAMADLRLSMVQKFSNLPVAFFSDVETIDLLSRFSSDMDRVENSMTKALPSLVECVLVSCACLMTIFWIDWRIALAASVLIPIGFIGNARLGNREDRLNSETRHSKNRMLGSVEDFIKSWLLIRAFNDREHIWGRFEDCNNKYTRSSSEYSYCLSAMPIFSEYGVNMTVAIIVAVGAVLAIKGMLTLGTFIGCFALLRKVADGSGKTAKEFTAFFNAIRPLKRIIKLLEEKENTRDSADAQPFHSLKREIVFKDVSFGYLHGKPIIEGLNMSIQAGTSVAIVGSSGSGKSTILKLMMRIIEAESGSISCDGVGIGNLTIESLRKSSSSVLQESHLIRGTISENLRFGKSKATEVEILDAARLAEIHDFIIGLPQGYETHVDDRGSTLSGGQRQRIAIARAFLHNPELLFLDEPTSMLDPITEASISEAIQRLARGRTVVMVTHRLASSKHFDKIVVLHHGRIVEEGNHQQLLERRGPYAKLWEKQHGFSLDEEGHVKVSPERLKAVPIFSKLDDRVLVDLADQFDTETFEPSVNVINEGAKGDKFYIAVRGSLQVLKKDPEGHEKVVFVLHGGDYFGEIALLHSVPRTASVRTQSHTQCLSLSRERFKRLVASQPQLLEALEESISARK